jgi:transposase
MSFIRNKKNKDGKIYAYKVTSVWDPNKKQPRSISKYLGSVDEDGNIIPTGENRKIRQWKNEINTTEIEKLIQDFGDGFFVLESIKRSEIFTHMKKIFERYPELLLLMSYRICKPGAMYNCKLWLDGSVLSSLHKAEIKLSSQDISKILMYLGEESVQRNFFSSYLKTNTKNGKNVIIDATSLPNKINSEFSAWGYSDSGIDFQFRLHCVVDQETKKPLFYRNVPGNISDVSTLQATIEELTSLGVKHAFALVDSGYCSEENILLLRKAQIDFLTRLPAGRSLYKSLILNHTENLETVDQTYKYGKRALFIKKVKIDLYGADGYAYIVLNPHKKARDLEALINSKNYNKELSEKDKKLELHKFNNAGIFILISSKEIDINDIMDAYYTRQTVEQVFGVSKSDLDLLPIRCHSNATIRGYLFLQFLLLIIFLEIREKLKDHFTVDQALMALRTLKCKIYDSKIIVQEKTKIHKKIFELADLQPEAILVPISWGI